MHSESSLLELGSFSTSPVTLPSWSDVTVVPSWSASSGQGQAPVGTGQVSQAVTQSEYPGAWTIIGEFHQQWLFPRVAPMVVDWTNAVTSVDFRSFQRRRKLQHLIDKMKNHLSRVLIWAFINSINSYAYWRREYCSRLSRLDDRQSALFSSAATVSSFCWIFCSNFMTCCLSSSIISHKGFIWEVSDLDSDSGTFCPSMLQSEPE